MDALVCDHCHVVRAKFNAPWISVYEPGHSPALDGSAFVQRHFCSDACVLGYYTQKVEAAKTQRAQAVIDGDITERFIGARRAESDEGDC